MDSMLFVLALLLVVSGVAFYLGRLAKAVDVAEAVTRDQAICCNCGDILPFQADGDHYRCSTCVDHTQPLPRMQSTITTDTKPPPETPSGK